MCRGVGIHPNLICREHRCYLNQARKPITVRIEHPLGAMDVTVDIEGEGTDTVVHSAEILRTARKLASGSLHVPAGIWEG